MYRADPTRAQNKEPQSGDKETVNLTSTFEQWA
jgi:hypothetical protein